MSSKSTYFTLPITFVAVIATVVACGPSKDYVPVRMKTATDDSQAAMAACRDGLRKSNSIHVGGEQLKTPICRYDVDESGVGAYSKTPMPITYTINRTDNKLNINLSVLAAMPEGTNAETNQHVKWVLLGNCLRDRIKPVWNRSVSADTMGLILNVTTASADAHDQELDFVLDPALSVAGYPAYRMSQWPERGAMFPYGKKADTEACATFSLKEKAECEAAARGVASANFCGAFAVAVGEWLGISPDEGVEKECPDTPAETVARQAAKKAAEDSAKAADKTLVVEPSVVNPKALTDSASYFETARLSKQNISTLLGHSCASAAAAIKAGATAKPVATGAVVPATMPAPVPTTKSK